MPLCPSVGNVHKGLAGACQGTLAAAAPGPIHYECSRPVGERPKRTSERNHALQIVPYVASQQLRARGIRKDYFIGNPHQGRSSWRHGDGGRIGCVENVARVQQTVCSGWDSLYDIRRYLSETRERGCRTYFSTAAC